MINPNDPAFPFAWEGKQTEDGKEISIVTHKQSGLSIRAELAARAMQGYLSAQHRGYNKDTLDWIAKASVEYADALIAELNK